MGTRTAVFGSRRYREALALGPRGRGASAGQYNPGTRRVRSWGTSSTVHGGERMPTSRSSAITPSAARLTESLRDIGYDFPAAVADIVDNSIMAGAARVEIVIEFDGAYS